jgi:GntR family transcriptional regulator of vanillate catabolism
MFRRSDDFSLRMNTQQTSALVRIREMILRGKLAPGQRLAEAPLAESLGMSRTPVRQALPVLAREGLLQEHETRGYIVRGFSIADILDALDVRGALEGLAARRVAEAGASRTLINALRQVLKDGDRVLSKGRIEESDEALYADMNGRMHGLIVQDARSSMIGQALERISHVPFASPTALVSDKTSRDYTYHRLVYAHRQHHFIVDALERGEGARVEALMREHVNPVKESLNLLGIPESHRATTTLLSLAR